ncbi:Leucine-rich repeat (LRR) protein [Hahella chejuensis KCTC 2396]|uniref:Leucine-rich repeat (LRR) protein n=1 Tax=Hahella chejuensis (strain KCTC 2396) TaxID=349521 RepID=Q2SLW7_HAHCH|nr:Leucine-rich repeat (LRR) protein [Hahella chejuensis KCTC 2396]
MSGPTVEKTDIDLNHISYKMPEVDADAEVIVEESAKGATGEKRTRDIKIVLKAYPMLDDVDLAPEFKSCIKETFHEEKKKDIGYVREIYCPDVKVDNIRGVAEFVNLESFNLHSYSPQTVTGSEELLKLTRLRLLRLEKVTLDDMHIIEKITDLTTLELVGLNLEELDIWSKLTQLNEVDIHGSTISSLEPIISHPGVAYLTISAGQLNSIEQLSDFPAYNYLNIYGLKQNEAEYLANLKDLKQLALKEAVVYDFSFLEDMTRLTYLSISTSSAIDNLSFLAKLTNLRSLMIEAKGNVSMAPLTQLKGLDYLYLDGLSVTDLDRLYELESVKSLNFANNKIQDFSVIGLMPWIETLYIAGNPVTSVKFMENNLGVRSLTLARTPLNDIDVVFGLPNLKTLTLYDSNSISCAQIEKIKEELELDRFDAPRSCDNAL